VFFRRARSLSSFDIGSSAVKAVELWQTSNSYEVVAIGNQPVSPDSVVDGAIIDCTVASDVVSQLFEKNGIKTKGVVPRCPEMQ